MADDVINNRTKKPVTVNISNRHVHLSQNDVNVLFGKGYQLTKIKDLIQPGEHACRETVTIVGKKGELKKVRVLGPVRKKTQIEISLTDSIHIGAKAPIRLSGDVSGSAPIKIVGPSGELDLNEGCIVAKRHLHMTPKDAAFYGIKDKSLISIKCDGDRSLIFNNVIARVNDKMVLECHLDTDEANAAAIKNGAKVVIL